MKHLNAFHLAAVAVAVVASGVPSGASASQALARKYACVACHQVEGKSVGPSFREIEKSYAATSTTPAQLAATIQAGSKGKWGGMAMPPQAQVSPADLEALAAWVLEGAK